MKRFFVILGLILMTAVMLQGQYIGTSRPMSRQETLDSLATKLDSSAYQALLDSLAGKADSSAINALWDSLGAKPDTSAIRALNDSLALKATKTAMADSLALRILILLPLPSADSTATGWKVTLTAGENLAFGNFCYEDTAGKYRKVDADTTATMPASVVALATITADNSGLFLRIGYLRASGWGTLLKGKPCYPDTAAGKFTQTIPAGSGDIVQKMGHAETVNTIWFEPGDRTIIKRK